jgi:hypothetical protein
MSSNHFDDSASRSSVLRGVVASPARRAVAPKWEPSDMIPLGRRTLRVIGVRYIDDEPTVLIVEDMSE